MKLDPMQRSRDFTLGKHPRRGGVKTVQQQFTEVNTRLATAFDAFGGGGDGGSLILDDLPEADSSYIGKPMTIRTPAGQPSAVYVGSQDAFDNPVWVPVQAGDPTSFGFQRTLDPYPSVSPGWEAVGIAATPRRVYVSFTNFLGDGEITVNTLDGEYVSVVSASVTPYPGLMTYDRFNDRVAIASSNFPFTAYFQVWDSSLSSLLYTIGSSGTGNGQFGRVLDVAADGAGNWYAFDRASAPRVQKLTASGSYIDKWGSAGTGDGQFTANSPHSLAVDSTDNVHVLDPVQMRVQRFTSAGVFLSSYGAAGIGPGQFVEPRSIRATSDGLVMITDQGAGTVLVFGNDGSYITTFALAQAGYSASIPSGIAEQDGRIYVLDPPDTGVSVSVWTKGGAPGGSVVVARGGTVVSRKAAVVDFTSDFVVTESPSGEANVGLDLLGPAALGVIGIYQDSDYTGSNVNTAQKIFNESANGAANVAASTAYKMEGVFHIHTTGTTSHALSIGFGGTATLTSIGYEESTALTPAATEIVAATASRWIDTAAMTAITNPVAAATHHTVHISGTVRVNGAGTFIPQYQFSAAPGVAPVTLKNSYLELTPIGSNTVTTVGSWS